MDYGGLNRLIGREVGEEFWGTRTQHIVGVAAALALTGKSALVSLYHIISCVRYEYSAIWVLHLAFISHYLTAFEPHVLI